MPLSKDIGTIEWIFGTDDLSDPSDQRSEPRREGGGDQEEPEEPPTKKRKVDAKKIAPAKYWVFTMFNPPEDWQTIIQKSEKFLDGYICGYELCPETGTPHIQGWTEFKKKNRPLSLLKDWPHARWAKAKGSAAHNWDYCTKDDTNVIHYGTGTAAQPYMVDCPPHKWCYKLKEVVAGPKSNRDIYWVWEPMGRAGKTTWQKHMITHNKDMRIIMLSGKASDMKNAIIQYKEKNGQLPECVFVNVPRSVDEKFLSYQGLEEIKDMLFYSGKYEGGMVCGQCPHLMIFANYQPESTSNFSKDRWVVIRIPDGQGTDDIMTRFFNWSEEPDCPLFDFETWQQMNKPKPFTIFK